MIATDGTATICTATEQDEMAHALKCAQRRSANILRAWSSACSAYPDASYAFQVGAAATRARVSRAAVLAELSAVSGLDWREDGVTDHEDTDPNRWNLH